MNEQVKRCSAQCRTCYEMECGMCSAQSQLGAFGSPPCSTRILRKHTALPPPPPPPCLCLTPFLSLIFLKTNHRGRLRLIVRMIPYPIFRDPRRITKNRAAPPQACTGESHKSTVSLNRASSLLGPIRPQMDSLLRRRSPTYECESRPSTATGGTSSLSSTHRCASRRSCPHTSLHIPYLHVPSNTYI